MQPILIAKQEIEHTSRCSATDVSASLRCDGFNLCLRTCLETVEGILTQDIEASSKKVIADEGGLGCSK